VTEATVDDDDDVTLAAVLELDDDELELALELESTSCPVWRSSRFLRTPSMPY
jgi:hypothetical protein